MTIPRALLAVIPLIGVSGGAPLRAGVPAAEGVLARNNGLAGGAVGTDCSALVLSPISISSSSEDGKSSGGGDDILIVGSRSENQSRRVATRQKSLRPIPDINDFFLTRINKNLSMHNLDDPSQVSTQNHNRRVIEVGS